MVCTCLCLSTLIPLLSGFMGEGIDSVINLCANFMQFPEMCINSGMGIIDEIMQTVSSL